MPKKYRDRIEKLLAEIKSIDLSPDFDSNPVLPALTDPLSAIAQSNGGSNGHAPVPRSGGKTTENDKIIQADALPGPAAPALQGAWGEFLDGIHRQEKIGYVFDRSGVQAVDTVDTLIASQHLLDAKIQVSGEEIGRILLDGAPEHDWSQEDKELVEAVALRLAQQIETLRLLDEAERSRADAEEAFYRLARLSGQVSQEEPSGELHGPALSGWSEKGAAIGIRFDSATGEVLPDDGPANGGANGVVSTPLRVGSDVLGHLEVAGQTLAGDETGLVETLAQRLARQVENLQLLDQSRHFRSETEDAIRRLTYQSWQAYLSASAKSGLGFQYDTQQVYPLDPASPMQKNAFPLKVREEVIGRLSVEKLGVPGDEAANLIDVISDRLSAHLDGLRLAEQREQALSETELMYSISSRLSTAQSLEDALSSVSEPARSTGVRDSRLFFITIDDHGQPEGLTLAAVWDPEDGAQIAPGSGHFLLNDYPVYWKVLQDSANPILVGNVDHDPRLDAQMRAMFHKTGAKAAAVLPLSVSGRWVGIVFINWDQPHAFSEQENRLYASLSRQAAVVVNNRLLLDQTRKRAQELQTVAQVSTAASTILDPQVLLQTVVDLTKSSFSLYHAQVFLLDEAGSKLTVSAGAGETGRLIVQEGTAIGADSPALVSRAARERQVVISNDVQNDAGFRPVAFLPEVRSEMAVPMVVGDHLLGVFNVQANTINRFSREDARIYTTLASQIAVAMQNAALYAEQAATVERLRELDHLKSAFLANMSHELRTPLNSILGFADVLLLELDGPLTETMTNDIHLIEKNGKHLLSLINDVLDMAKIEAGKMNLAFERFMLRDLLEETMDITSSLVREKGLYLTIAPESEDRMDLVADRVRIRQVMINVVSNAVKFTEKGGITINVTRNNEERRLRIQVQDTGMGIPPAKLEMIFESFSQVDTSTTRKVGGTGLGLPISRRLVEMHGGHMWAESAGLAGQGSTFIIELPFEAVKRS